MVVVIIKYTRVPLRFIIAVIGVIILIVSMRSLKKDSNLFMVAGKVKIFEPNVNAIN